MANNFQDDDREEGMRALFGLYKDETEGRSGIDAFMNIDGANVQFELKTTSTGSVTTVRDFGPDHIVKWENKHWLFGFHMNGRIFYKYGTPDMMSKWISEKEAYISPDFQLANILATKLSLADMYKIVGKKDKYTLADAKSIQKKQYSIVKYKALQDLDSGYSQKRMLEILNDRSKYLIERGSTLNNPHIPESYFKDWIEITNNHASELESLVRAYLSSF